MKKPSKLILITVLVIILIPTLILLGSIWLSPKPPKPEIKYGAFPFELVYTLDGQTKTITDVLVCEYDGIGFEEGQGKYVKWKTYIKSSKEESLVLINDGTKKIICDIGSASYYMGDPSYNITDNTPKLLLIENHGEITTSRDLSEEDMENYKIKIISWEIDKPIKNTFK